MSDLECQLAAVTKERDRLAVENAQLRTLLQEADWKIGEHHEPAHMREGRYVCPLSENLKLFDRIATALRGGANA